MDDCMWWQVGKVGPVEEWNRVNGKGKNLCERRLVAEHVISEDVKSDEKSLKLKNNFIFFF